MCYKILTMNPNGQNKTFNLITEKYCDEYKKFLALRGKVIFMLNVSKFKPNTSNTNNCKVCECTYCKYNWYDDDGDNNKSTKQSSSSSLSPPPVAASTPTTHPTPNKSIMLTIVEMLKKI